jgi:hypothetical protein
MSGHDVIDGLGEDGELVTRSIPGTHVPPGDPVARPRAHPAAAEVAVDQTAEQVLRRSVPQS